MFNATYRSPARQPKLGHYSMVAGLLMILFIGFNRIWHFTYIRLDAMLCGFFRLTKLPAASTFWRYLDSLSINQAQSLLKLMSVLRERVWQQLGISYYRVCIDIDTNVETLYSNQQGGRKCRNTKNRGKKGYRPVLCFIEQTREIRDIRQIISFPDYTSEAGTPIISATLSAISSTSTPSALRRYFFSKASLA